jgi:ribosome biogenesis GTPase A
MASGWVTASNWFPGHMVKATRELTQRLAKVDFVIEVRDARVPVSSAAAHLDRALRETGRQDRRIVALNKMDLLSEAQRAAIQGHLGESVRLISTRTGEGIKELLSTVVSEVQRHSPRLISKASPLPPSVAGLPSLTGRTAWTPTAQPGMTAAASSAPLISSEVSARSMRLSGGSAPCIRTGGALPLILMVVGVPNTGKSSLINALRQASPHSRERQRKSAKPAKTGSMPGVTRHLSGFQVETLCSPTASSCLARAHFPSGTHLPRQAPPSSPSSPQRS